MSDLPPQPRKRTRSPAYPAIPLEDAIQKSTALWEKAKRHWIGVTDAVKYWDYEPTSSKGHSALSALKKFGLLEEQGANDAREVRLTEAATKLVFNPDEESEEHRKALKMAALTPAIHAELWSKYEGDLPDDAIVERHLVLERLFNAEYVKSFIKQFRETISFAGLTADDKVSSNLDDQSPMPTAQQPRSLSLRPVPVLSVAAQRLTSAPAHEEPALQIDSRREIRLPHPAGDITIRGPFPMTSSDWTTFTALIAAFKTWLVKDDTTASSTASPQPVVQSPSDAQE